MVFESIDKILKKCYNIKVLKNQRFKISKNKEREIVAKKAAKIRSIMRKVEYFSGLMVSALSGKSAEFRDRKPSLHAKNQPIPSLGNRRIIVKKKIDLADEVGRQSVENSVSILRDLNAGVKINNSQSGGTRQIFEKSHPLGENKLSSKEREIVDHKRSRRRPKGSQRVTSLQFREGFV